MSELPIGLRPALTGDIPFILNSWMLSHLDWLRSGGGTPSLSNAHYFEWQKPRVERLIATSVTLVAHNPEDEDQIYGYAVYRTKVPMLMHYVFVKYPFRKLGVARRLFHHANPKAIMSLCSHTGRLFEEVRERYLLEYDPSQIDQNKASA